MPRKYNVSTSSSEAGGRREPPPLPVDEDDDDEPEMAPPVPPDGGWGWVVVVGSLMCNIIVDGVCFSYGIFYREFLDYFQESRAKTAFVGSLIPGMYLGMGPVVSALANKFGCRVVTIAGAVVASISFFASTFSPNVNVLIFTYGIMGGIGFGLMYLPAIVIVGFYFDKKRAFATGLAVCGSGIGTFLFAPFGRYLLENYGWKGAYWIIAGIILNGCVCGALFRPLQAVPIRRRRAMEMKEMSTEKKHGTIFSKIIEQKKRMRTISTGSLDGSIITKDNKLIKDPEKIKNIKNQALASLQEVEEEDQPSSPPPVPNGKATKFSQLSQKSIPNGIIERLKVEDRAFRPPQPLPQPPKREPEEKPEPEPADSNPLLPKHRDKDIASSTRSLSDWNTPEDVPMRSRAMSETRKTRQRYRVSRTGEKILLGEDGPGPKDPKLSLSKASLRGLDLARPMNRKDIFFTGSIKNLPEYKNTPDMASYIASTTSLPSQEELDAGKPYSPVWNVLKEMMDFSLMKSPTFLLLCVTSILAMTGFFTPFVYIMDHAVQQGTEPMKATLLLFVLGVFNTLGRIISGFISDRSWADCIIIHNVALIIAGGATCLVPLLNNIVLLGVYCGVFGSCIAAFITLRSIVLVELLGLQKLTSSFGLLLLFQGIASLIGSPIAGALFDCTQAYTVPFIFSGGLIAVAGIMALFVRRVARWETARWGPLGGSIDYTQVRINSDVNPT